VAAEPPFRDEHALTVFRQIRDLHDLAVATFVHDRAGGHLQVDRLARLARAVRAFAVAAAAGFEVLLESVVEKGVEVGVRDEENGTAGSPVAAIGAAARHELLAPEAQCPFAAMTGGDVDVNFVYEHGSPPFRRAYSCRRMLITRPRAP
jgi:hypothetical protein